MPRNSKAHRLVRAISEGEAPSDGDAGASGPGSVTFLVQPFLTSDVVGSGGPNVVALLDAVRVPFAATAANAACRDPPDTPDPGYRTFCGT